MYKHKQHGFTIVELIIVIVVIGILAMITVISYNGSQQHARNVARGAEATHIIELLSTYAAANGTYPIPSWTESLTSTYCVGKGYPDTNHDGLGECTIDFNGTEALTENKAFNDALSTVGSLSNYPYWKVPGNQTVYGLVILRYENYKFNGSRAHYVLRWVLEGELQDCGLPVFDEQSDGVFVSTTRKYTRSGDGQTTCMVSLENPPKELP